MIGVVESLPCIIMSIIFEGKKQARKFDVEEMFMLARKTAKETSKFQGNQLQITYIHDKKLYNSICSLFRGDNI